MPMIANRKSSRLLILLFMISSSLRSQDVVASKFEIYKPNYFSIDLGCLVKFQISYKFGIGVTIENYYIEGAAIYSQKSFWDLDKLSSPFRESNYNPGLLFGIRKRNLPIRLEVIGEHESNGQDSKFSRSWNKASVALGLEKKPWLTSMNLKWSPLIQESKLPTDAPPGIEDKNLNRVDDQLRKQIGNWELTSNVKLFWRLELYSQFRLYISTRIQELNSFETHLRCNIVKGFSLGLMIWYGKAESLQAVPTHTNTLTYRFGIFLPYH